MKACFKITTFLLSIFLTSICLGMEKSEEPKDFQTQLKDFLTGDSMYPLEEYKVFAAKYESIIIEYISNGDIDLKQMISSSFKTDYYAKYLVHRVAQIGNLRILKAIIEKDAEMIEIQDTSGKSPLSHACEYSNAPCVQYLLEKKAKPMKMFVEKTSHYSIHPIYYIISIWKENPPINDQIKILDMIIKKCPQFLTHKYKDQNCLECVEELMSPDHNWTCYPQDNPYEIKVKKEKIEYLAKFQKFIKAKTRLRRFAHKEE